MTSLERKEGAGKAGCPMHPQPRVQGKKHTSIVTTGSPNWSGLPCANGFDGLYVLSPVNGLFCHRRRRNYFRRLDSSVAAPGPHDFAVRFSATRQRHLRVHRIPPHVRDDAYAPLVEAGCANSTTVSDFRKKIFLASGLETQISLNPLTKLAFRRKRFRAVEDRTSEVNRCELIKLICPVPGKSTSHAARC